MAQGGKKKIRAPEARTWGDLGLMALARAGSVVASIVDRLGWPGFLFVCGYVFVERHATDEQKREIVDTFVLGKGLPSGYPLLAMGALFLLVIAAQQVVWRKRVRVLEEEKDRLAAWKTAHQSAEVLALLHNSEGTRQKKN